jgi:hypothetical protein
MQHHNMRHATGSVTSIRDVQHNNNRHATGNLYATCKDGIPLLRHRADEPENLFSEGVSPHAPIAAVRAVAAPPAPAEPVDVDAVLLAAIPPRLKVPPPPPWTQRSHARGYKRAARARTHPRTPASMRARTRTPTHPHARTHARTHTRTAAAWQVLKRLLRTLALAHMAQQPDAYSVRPCDPAVRC